MSISNYYQVHKTPENMALRERGVGDIGSLACSKTSKNKGSILGQFLRDSFGFLNSTLPVMEHTLLRFRVIHSIPA